MLRRVITLMAVAALLGIVMGLIRGALVAPLTVNPRVQLDPKETYHISVWVSLPATPRSELFAQAVEGLIASFTSAWSNIAVTTTFTPDHLLHDSLREALSQGQPPDVLVHSTYSPANYGPLQVPLGIYVTPEEQAHLPSAIIAQLSVGGVLGGLPLGYTFRAFAANPALFQAAGAEIERFVRDGWTWDEFFAAVQRLNQSGKRGLVTTNVHLPLLRSVAATIGAPSPFSEDGTLTWNIGKLQAIGEVARRLGSSAGTGDTLQADEDALARFLHGQAGLIGPLNPELSRWLMLTAQKQGLSPLLLPTPSNGPSQMVDIAVVSVALFRQTAFRGHRHTRAAAELAKHMSKEGGNVFSTHLALLADNAHAPAHLNIRGIAAAYANLALAPSAPYTIFWEMGENRASWEDPLLPVWLRLLAGELSPSDFANEAYTALSHLEKR